MTRPPFSHSDRFIHPLAVVLLIGLIASLLYSNTFSASFHFDDAFKIVDNPKIKHLANLLDLSGSRYVGFLSFALNYHFGQMNVFGYHLVNLLIHIANGVQVYLLILLLFKTPRLASSPFLTPVSHWIALATALLFIAHPIQTQAVTYIVQRFAALATLFYLLTVLCYLKWRLSSSQSRSRFGWYASAFIAMLLAMKTKEITFTLPFMLLLVEAVFFGPLTRRQWMGLIPFFLTLPIIPLSRPGALGEGEAGFARDANSLSRPDYLFTQFRVIVTYLRLLVFPVDQNLDYDYPASHSLFELPVILSFLFLASLVAAAVYLLFYVRRPTARLMAFGILWFFLTLSIESSLIPIRDVIFEHRLYLPTVGIWLAVSAALLGYSERWRFPSTIAVGILVLMFSAVTYQRNKIWLDEFTLWSDVVQKSPQKARGHNNLGAAYKNLGNFNEAIQEFKTAFSLQPDYAEAHGNLGLVYKTLRRFDEAVQEYQTALSIKPDYAEAHNNLGTLYAEQGRRMDAIQEYHTAISLSPNYAEAHNNLGIAYHDLGRRDEAIREYQIALFLKPDNANAHLNLGVIFKEMGKLDEAIQEYKKALSLEPHLALIHDNLGEVLDKQGKILEAFGEIQEAIRLKPDDALAHYNLGTLYREMGQYEKAVQEYKTATRLDPDYAEAHNNLGLGYFVGGRLSEALLELKEAVRAKPDYAEAHNNLGVILKELGHLEDAVGEFQTALKLKPDYVDAYFNMGNTYQHMGRTAEAIRAYEQALRIKPDYDKARQALNALRR